MGYDGDTGVTDVGLTTNYQVGSTSIIGGGLLVPNTNRTVTINIDACKTTGRNRPLVGTGLPDTSVGVSNEGDGGQCLGPWFKCNLTRQVIDAVSQITPGNLRSNSIRVVDDNNIIRSRINNLG